MMRQMNKRERAEAVRHLKAATGQGIHTALLDLLQAELGEIHLEMESAQDAETFWRAQGKAMCLRNLLAAVTNNRSS